jgi:hypothetical protein
VKSKRRLLGVRNVARVGEAMNDKRFWYGNLVKNGHMEDQERDGNIVDAKVKLRMWQNAIFHQR